MEKKLINIKRKKEARGEARREVTEVKMEVIKQIVQKTKNQNLELINQIIQKHVILVLHHLPLLLAEHLNVCLSLLVTISSQQRILQILLPNVHHGQNEDCRGLEREH